MPSYSSWLALPHWVFTSTSPTRSMRLCYPWLVSRLFTHDLRESKLHHSLCCGLIEYHDVYCIRQAILTQGSTSAKDLRARGLLWLGAPISSNTDHVFSRREALPLENCYQPPIKLCLMAAGSGVGMRDFSFQFTDPVFLLLVVNCLRI